MQSFKRSLSRFRRKLNYLFRSSFIHPIKKKKIKKYRDLLSLSGGVQTSTGDWESSIEEEKYIKI
jgi:hypothetical protein